MRRFEERNEKEEKRVMRSPLTSPNKGCSGAYLTAGMDDPRERYKWVIEDGISAEVKSLHRQDGMKCNHNSEGGVDGCWEKGCFFHCYRSSYQTPHYVLGLRDSSGKKPDKDLALMNLYSSERTNNRVKK